MRGRIPLAAQGDDRSSVDESFGELALLDVVREAVVIALVQPNVGPFLLDRLGPRSPLHGCHDAVVNALCLASHMGLQGARWATQRHVLLPAEAARRHPGPPSD